MYWCKRCKIKGDDNDVEHQNIFTISKILAIFILYEVLVLVHLNFHFTFDSIEVPVLEIKIMVN